ncbi:formate dehydrogenase [Streptomyces sp. SID8379]|uniref:formate dehydrogenase beta subunit n=1 Tax=unclassified Streptomyces TaxID=2593676 RepID=UPI000996ADAD|nr:MULTISPECIES: NADH-quinone oxidoreductase subunit NuoF [unclassified Streptomyces]MYW62722.1 formate dehydrogenase [Streptomyces sp. SID8379]
MQNPTNANPTNANPTSANPADANATDANPTSANPLSANPTLVYVPRDSAARSVGADEVATALQQAGWQDEFDNFGIEVVRNGSRGALWLEPLVEVVTEQGRIGYGPVTPDDVPGLLAAGMLNGGEHPLRLGLMDQLPWLARQNRVTFARVGVIDPLSPEDYVAHGGLRGLRAALALDPADVVAQVTESGLRGRGGAGFPAGIKWKTVLDCPAEGDDLKFVCCNADEGDSGTFADRMVMEGDPFLLIEGMAIAAHAVGAREGYIYLRSEYPDAVATMNAAIEIAHAQGWLGKGILGSSLDFDLKVRVGAGAYICGEETSMLESLEGKRGMVRAKPPIPAIEGLFGRPTVVNNVLTLTTVPVVLADGPKAYQDLGVGRSRGTQVFQLGGNIKRGGIVETAFGITLRELIEDYGGGTLSGRPVRTVQVGGPLGAYLPVEQFDLPMDYEAFAEAGAMLGHGGVVVFDDSVDMAAQARFAMEFCAEESCGKCTPCRVGAVRGVEVIDRIVAGTHRDENLALLEDLCDLMTDGSLCAMGGLTPMPVRSALAHFPDDFLGGRKLLDIHPVNTSVTARTEGTA